MVISELLEKAAGLLFKSGSDNAVFEARYIVAFALKMPTSALILNPCKEVLKQDEDAVMCLIKRRISGEPFQYILGTQEFMGLEFSVTYDVLIPRQDTETLAEFILEKCKNAPISLLDIGTGTGCIPISIAHFNPFISCLGIDISENALNLAQKNAETLNVSDRVSFEKCDILNDIPNGTFDIVVSNPPYIKSDIIPTLQTEVKDFEPLIALDGGADGLEFYKRICGIAPKILKKDGLLALEIGYDQSDAVISLLKADFRDITVTKDLAGNDRVVSGYLK